MILTTHHYQVPRVRTSGAILLLPLYVHGVYRNDFASTRKVYVRVTPNTRRVPAYFTANVPNTDRSDGCAGIMLKIRKDTLVGCNTQYLSLPSDLNQIREGSIYLIKTNIKFSENPFINYRVLSLSHTHPHTTHTHTHTHIRGVVNKLSD